MIKYIILIAIVALGFMVFLSFQQHNTTTPKIQQSEYAIKISAIDFCKSNGYWSCAGTDWNNRSAQCCNNTVPRNIIYKDGNWNWVV
jgi:hypothetical protein